MSLRSNKRFRTALNLAGAALAVASIVFVARLLLRHGGALAELIDSRALWLSILGAAVVHSTNGLLLALAWTRLVSMAGADEVATQAGLSIYGRAQIAKYLPGNTLHLLGRHAMGVRHGIAHRPQLFAAVLELALFAAAAAVLGTYALRPGGQALQNLAPAWLNPRLLAILGLIGATALAIVALKTAAGSAVRRGGWGATVLQVFTLHIAYYCVLGAAMLPSIWLISGVWAPLTSISAISLAMVLGLITPGAPSGIGVREAALVLLLAPLMGEPQAALVSLAFRVVTVLGDLGFFLIAVRVGGRHTDPVAPPQSQR